MANYSRYLGADHRPGTVARRLRLAPSQVVNEATAVAVCAQLNSGSSGK